MESIKKELDLIQQIKEMNKVKYARKGKRNNFPTVKINKVKFNKDNSKILPKSKPLY